MSNRYTQIQQSAYNPMSLQEIMMAPMYQRKQHDSLLAASQEYFTDLNKYDATDRDWDELQKEKARVSEELGKRVDYLNKEGFSQASKDDFLKFNQDYQQTVSPTGKLGQFLSNKQQKELKIAEFLQNATAMGYSPEQAQYWIDKSEEDYQGKPIYDEKGRVTGFDTSSYLPPEHVDVEGWIRGLFKDAQISMEDFARSGSKIVQDQQGNYVVSIGTKWGGGTNKESLESAKQYLEKELNRKDSKARKYLDWTRQDPNEPLSSLDLLQGVYKREDIVDHYSDNISNFSPHRSQEGVPGMDVYSHSDMSQPALPVGESYTKIRKNANEVLNNNNEEFDNKLKARQYLQLTDRVHNDLLDNDEQYSKNFKELTNLVNESDLPDNLKQQLSEGVDIEYIPDSFSGTELVTPSHFIINGEKYDERFLGDDAAELKSIRRKYLNLQSDIDKKRSERIKTEGFERTIIRVPFDKTSDYSKENLEAIKSLTVDNVHPLDISYYDNSGRNKPLGSNPEEAAAMMGLFGMSDPDDIKKLDVAKRGNQVGFVIEFTPKKGTVTKRQGLKNIANFNITYSGTEKVEMFVPIVQEIDPITGLKHTPTQFFNKLPPGPFKEQVQKMIHTRELSSADNFKNVGQAKVPMTKYFGRDIEGYSLDFKTNNHGKNQTYTPFIITDSVENNKEKRPLKWNEIIDYESLEDPELEDAYNGLLLHSKVDKVLIKSAKKIKDPDNNQQSLYDKFDYRGSGDFDLKGLMNYMKTKNIELGSPADIWELSNFSRLIRGN